MKILCILILVSGCRVPDFTTKHQVAVYLEACKDNPDFVFPTLDELEHAYDYYIDHAPDALGLSADSVRDAVWYTELVLQCGTWMHAGYETCGYRLGDPMTPDSDRYTADYIRLQWDTYYDFILFHEYTHIAFELENGYRDSRHEDRRVWDADQQLGRDYVAAYYDASGVKL